MTDLLPLEGIAQRILLIRGQKVLLDSDLAKLYGVETKVLLQAVKRHLERFPEDFMFQLSQEEFLRSQSVTSNKKHPSRGGRRYAPYAFTEQGTAMLSSVLNSQQAIQVNIAIMRAFVKLRETLVTNRELAQQFKELSHKVESHDQAIAGLIHTLRELMRSPEPQPKPIGFVLTQEKPKKDR